MFIIYTLANYGDLILSEMKYVNSGPDKLFIYKKNK